MGFNVAARVAEVAGGRPFEDLVRDELLEPLGMKDTRYVPFGMQALRAGPKLPNGESRFIMAGGGMTSTLDDFAAFYQMQLNGGTYRGRRILSEKSVAEMQTRQGKLDLMMSAPTATTTAWRSSSIGSTPTAAATSSPTPASSAPTPGSTATARSSACCSSSPISCGSSPPSAGSRRRCARPCRPARNPDRRRTAEALGSRAPTIFC